GCNSVLSVQQVCCSAHPCTLAFAAQNAQARRQPNGSPSAEINDDEPTHFVSRCNWHVYGLPIPTGCLVQPIPQGLRLPRQEIAQTLALAIWL
ncbi:hypothetical protein LY76DRAFT_680156, partial [Colletotrichum caudatum]